jgi:hypothetical protein
MFQGEGRQSPEQLSRRLTKCHARGTNWLRPFYMVEGISYRPFGAESHFSGRKARISVSDPCLEHSAIPGAFRAGMTPQMRQVRTPVSRRNAARICARIGPEK